MVQTLAIIALLFCSGASDEDQASSKPAVVQASGVGRPPPNMTGPQAKLMARRAAEVIAVRNLAARLQGRAAQHASTGTGHASVDALIRGYRYLPATVLPDGSVEVTVELPLPMLTHNHEQVADEAATLRAQLHELQDRLAREREQTRAALAELKRKVDALVQELIELRRAVREALVEQSARSTAPTPNTP
jgi:hypothetical protein